MNDEKLTPEQIAHKAEKTAKKEAKNKAYDVIFAFIEKSGTPAEKKALATVRPSLYGISTGGGASSAHSKFLAMFANVGTKVDEGKVFMEMKAGRKECSQMIKKGLKNGEASARKWISFDPKTGIYVLVAVGEKTPADWTGYVPVSVEVEDLK